MRWLRLRALLLVTLGLFAVFLVGLLLTGHAHENQDLADHGRPAQSLVQYAGSASFGEAVFENWESEFVQMGMYVLLTAYLVQKGSAESRPIGKPAPQDEDPAEHRDDPHAVTGARTYSEDQVLHGGQAVTTWQYAGSSQFWFESFQNWQSEFLAVAALIGGSIYLRQRRSPQSKPVHTPNSETSA